LEISKTAAAEGFAILAYCYMPDHLHLLVKGTTVRADLRRFAQIARQRAAVRHSARTGSVLWQSGYHDRVLRDDEATGAAIRYLLNNPVRAGLVSDAAHYPFAGSEVHSLDELMTFLFDLERRT